MLFTFYIAVIAVRAIQLTTPRESLPEVSVPSSESLTHFLVDLFDERCMAPRSPNALVARRSSGSRSWRDPLRLREGKLIVTSTVCLHVGTFWLSVLLTTAGPI